MTMTIEQQAREEMVRSWRFVFPTRLRHRLCRQPSLLLPDGALLATPTGSCLGELQADRLK